jgi:hypothetical protein
MDAHKLQNDDCDGDDGDVEVAAPYEKAVKTDSARDLLTVFSDRIDVKFTKKDGSFEVLKGRWCLLCK